MKSEEDRDRYFAALYMCTYCTLKTESVDLYYLTMQEITNPGKQRQQMELNTKRFAMSLCHNSALAIRIDQDLET